MSRRPTKSTNAGEPRSRQGFTITVSSIVTLVLLSTTLTALSASAASVRWHDLRSVRVTVSNPSLPPPAGKAKTTAFLTHARVARAQAALNSHKIRRLAKRRSDANGCTGGYHVTIRIVKSDSTRVTLTAYRCANRTSGTIGGDLPGFLEAAGISPPR